MKLSRLSRLIHLLTALQSGNCGDVGELIKALNISRRTFYRDLHVLREAGVPCRFDRAEGGYFIQPGFFMPPPQLTAREAFSLMLLVDEAKSRLTLPFVRYAARAMLKVQSNLPSQIRQYCHRALGKISMVTPRKTSEHKIDAIFDLLHGAILSNRVVRIYYRCSPKGNLVETTLSPYRLVYDGDDWHVIGKPGLRDGIVNLELSRIDKVDYLGKRFIEGNEFDLSEHLGQAWSLVPERKLYRVKLRFSPEVAQDITRMRWHSTQHVRFQEDGSAIVEFRVDGIDEITWWVIAFGDKVQVLTPEVLQQRVCAIAKKMASLSQTERGELKPNETTQVPSRTSIVSIGRSRQKPGQPTFSTVTPKGGKEFE